MFKCPSCKCPLIWQNDYDEEDDRVLSVYDCKNADCSIECVEIIHE